MIFHPHDSPVRPTSRAIVGVRYLLATLLAVLCVIAVLGLAHAGTATNDLMNVLPPIVKDSTKAADCTVTWLVTNVTTNDTIAVRMQIASDENDKPVRDLMPCPAEVSPRVAARALDACIKRAADSKNCVFTDMGRDFDKRPVVDNTAENYSRCTSDKATDIGVACWRSGTLEVCDVGCGDSPATAVSAAVTRCEAKQQRQCPITGSRPVLAPK
jgi:hypothetical protein